MQIQYACQDFLQRLISLTHDLSSSLVLSLLLENRCPRGFSGAPRGFPARGVRPRGYPVHLADSQSARFSLDESNCPA